METEPSAPSLLQSIASGLVSQYRKLCASSPKKRSRGGYRPLVEQLEDRRMLSAVPLDFTQLSNTFAGDIAAEVSIVESGHENVRMQIANDELVMGVRDSLVSDAEYAPSAEKPLQISLKTRFANQDSLYVFTRSEGSTAVGGYRSSNEVRVELDMAGRSLRIYEAQGGSLSIIGQQADLDLPLNQNLNLTLRDDGKTVTVSVEQYTVSGETKGSYGSFKTGVSNWSGRTTVDDYVIEHGNETVQQETGDTTETPDTSTETQSTDTAFADIGAGVWNPFDNNTIDSLALVLSNHENSRIQVTNEELVMGVRDSAVSEEEYEPTTQSPLEVSLKARFVNQDSLYVFTRSEGSTAVGGYRSSNEVRVELDMAGRSLRIYEIQGGNLSIIGQQANLDLPMNQDLNVVLHDDGTTVTVTVEQYSVSGETTGSYGSFKTGVSNWSGRTVVDDYRIAQTPAPEGGNELQLMQAQIAVSAELTVQLEEEALILEEELDIESQQLLTSVSVTNTELSRIQGIQLFQRSSFYIHGNDIEPILQQNLPHIFPENLQAYIEEQSVALNEEPGHIQDRILMQQSDYRGILRSLLGSYETVMSDLLNKSVDMAARVQADASTEHDLMQELRTGRDTAAGLRYITEVAFFGVGVPTAEELYREGQRLFTEEHDLLTKIQSEQDRLQAIDNFRAGNRAWQLAHGVPDLAVLIGADEGTAENGYQGELSEAEQRRLGRAQRLVETAMSSMLDRRVQMRVVPDEVVIENRLVYAGDGVTHLLTHEAESKTLVLGTMGVIEGNITSRENIENGIAETGATFMESISVDVPHAADGGVNLGVIANSIDVRSTESMDIPQRGAKQITFTLHEEKMVNMWANGIAMRDVSLTIHGGPLPEAGYGSVKEGTTGESVSLRLTPGTYTVTVRDDTNYEGGSMATGDFTVPLELEMQPYNSADIGGRISIAERPEAKSVSLKVAEFIPNGNGEMQRNNRYDLDESEGGVSKLDPSKPVWVVVHGMNDKEESDGMTALAKAISESPVEGIQVVTVDWEDAAEDILRMGRDAPWTSAVGKWVAQQLSAAKIPAAMVNGAGHSHGTYVLWHMAKELEAIQEDQMNVLVALDPAGNVPLVSQFDHTQVHFSSVSRHSLAIEGSFIAGSDQIAGTADVSFKVNSPYTARPSTEHGLPPHVFTTILNHENAAPGTFSQHFSLVKLMDTQQQNTALYSENRYNEFFEGIIDIRSPEEGESLHLFDLRYISPSGEEETDALDTLS